METFKTLKDDGLTNEYKICWWKKEINCIGFFKNDFFDMDDLISRQKSIYELIAKLKSSSKETTDMDELYDITEHMRVNLLHAKCTMTLK